MRKKSEEMGKTGERYKREPEVHGPDKETQREPRERRPRGESAADIDPNNAVLGLRRVQEL